MSEEREMLERVARAIYEATDPHLRFVGDDPIYRAIAQAAIEAVAGALEDYGIKHKVPTLYAASWLQDCISCPPSPADRGLLGKEQETDRQAAEWQPIETAPKDRYFLAFVPGSDEEGTDDYVVQAWMGKHEVILCDGSDANGPKPTHWMPLPAPPSASLTADRAFPRKTEVLTEGTPHPPQRESGHD